MLSNVLSYIIELIFMHQCTDWGEFIHCSLDFNFLLTEHEGCTGGKKPKVLATQTKCSIVHTKMSESKYFPVWLKKVMSDASRYFITWYFYQTILFDFNLPAFENKNTQLISTSMEMVCVAKYEPSKNQSGSSDLPQDYLSIQ